VRSRLASIGLQPCEYWTKESGLVSLVWTGLRRPAGPQAGGTGPTHTNGNARRRATGGIAPGLVPVRPIGVDSPLGLRGQYCSAAPGGITGVRSTSTTKEGAYDRGNPEAECPAGPGGAVPCTARAGPAGAGQRVGRRERAHHRRCRATAIATSSGALSWSAAVPDGNQVSVEDVLATVRRLVAAVDLPVSADVEGGYATTPEGCR
jgi:hypothetical protein